MPKRRDRVAPPPVAGRWDFRFGTGHAVKGWEQTCAVAPSNARVAWEPITGDPRYRDARQHPLRGKLGTRTANARELEQWQYEVTTGGRIWYCIDDKAETVWMAATSPGHPKATER